MMEPLGAQDLRIQTCDSQVILTCPEGHFKKDVTSCHYVSLCVTMCHYCVTIVSLIVTTYDSIGGKTYSSHMCTTCCSALFYFVLVAEVAVSESGRKRFEKRYTVRAA